MVSNHKKTGLIAGIALLCMVLIAGFTYGYAHTQLTGDTAADTADLLRDDPSLFIIEILGWMIIFILDIIVAIALYHFFLPVSKGVSLTTSILRIIYTSLLGFAIYQLASILPILKSAGTLPDEIVGAQISPHLYAFETLWSQGLIFFGFHLIGLGYLLIASKLTYLWTGYLLYLGGACYIIIHAARQFHLAEIQQILFAEKILALPMALAEIVLAIWLIYFRFRKNTAAPNALIS